MPAAPISLTFSARTNEEILFLSIEDFNSWVAAITVTITGGNLPAAALVTLGGVKLAASVPYAPVAVVPTYATVANDEGAVEVPSKQTYLDLQAKVNALETFIVALKASMIAAGQLNA